MSKKLLFVMDTFPLGGIAKSLLSLFNELGSRYSIDFLLMKQEGLFLPLIPTNINLLEEPISAQFRNPHPRNIFKSFQLLSLREWLKWLDYSFRCTVGRLTGGLHRQVQIMDEWSGKNSRPMINHYDAAIAYQGGRCIYYIVENVNADIKIGYVHSDYLKNETDFMLYPSDKKYFPHLDSIVTISEECSESLKKAFSELSDKIKVVENLCLPSFINEMAQKDDNPFDDKFNGIRLLTMGRLDWSIKGLDFILESAKLLKEQCVDFRWYILGEGHGRDKMEKGIHNMNLGNRVILLGAKTNPYPYIKSCDIYVQPSRIEGKSVALDEVKALAKPIVVTNFSTVNDQFTDHRNALICEMNSNSIADSIITLINDESLRKELCKNLMAEKIGNEEQVKIFESLLDK